MVYQMRDLVRMGYSKAVLREIAETHKEIAWRLGDKKNSPYVFDKDKLDEFMKGVVKC